MRSANFLLGTSLVFEIPECNARGFFVGKIGMVCHVVNTFLAMTGCWIPGLSRNDRLGEVFDFLVEGFLLGGELGGDFDEEIGRAHV